MKHGTTMPILRYKLVPERSLRFILVKLFKQNISWCTFTTIKSIIQRKSNHQTSTFNKNLDSRLFFSWCDVPSTSNALQDRKVPDDWKLTTLCDSVWLWDHERRYYESNRKRAGNSDQLRKWIPHSHNVDFQACRVSENAASLLPGSTISDPGQSGLEIDGSRNGRRSRWNVETCKPGIKRTDHADTAPL